MSKSFLFALTSFVLALAITPAQAAPPADSPLAEQRVVVVDVARVFKNHRRFNQDLELLRQDAQTYQAMLRTSQEQLQQRVDLARAQDPNSAEFRQAESDLTQELAAMQVNQRQKGRELAEKEAKLYFDVYMEVSRAIAAYADNNAVNLVLRYNSDPIDPADPKSILEGVNREVMFQQNRDITDQIIATVNAGQAVESTANRTGPPNR